MLAMIKKEFRELRRDRRTVAMLIVMPLMMLVIFGYAAQFGVDRIDTTVVGPQADQVAGALQDPFDVTSVRPADGEATGRQLLRDGKTDVVIVADSEAKALVDGSNLFMAQTANAALGQAPVPVTVENLFNPELKTSYIMIPAIIGLILVFTGTMITSLGIVRERQAGTIEQLAVMPFRPSDVIAGKTLPYFVIALFNMTMITLLGVWIFGVPFAGSVLTFALGAVLFLLVVLGLGVLISSVSETPGQAIQLTLMTMLPQILLSGMIFPLESMGDGVRWIGYLLPLTYFIMISRGVMLRDAPFDSLVLPLGILAVFAAIVFTAAVLRFRRDLAPSRGRAAAPEPAGVAGVAP